jgi:hypothetical protein
VNPPPSGRMSYVASVLAFVAALGSLVQGNPAPAAVLALGGLFLIYWGRRLDREGET